MSTSLASSLQQQNAVVSASRRPVHPHAASPPWPCNLPLQAQADEPVSDAGMAHLTGLTQLSRLDLSGRKAVTAGGLAPLRTFTRLQHL